MQLRVSDGRCFPGKRMFKTRKVFELVHVTTVVVTRLELKSNDCRCHAVQSFFVCGSDGFVRMFARTVLSVCSTYQAHSEGRLAMQAAHRGVSVSYTPCKQQEGTSGGIVSFQPTV